MTFEVDNGSWHDADDLVRAAETAPPGGDNHGGRVKWAIAVAQQYGGHGTSGPHSGKPEVDGIIEALCILAAVSLPELQARGLRDSSHWFPNLHVDVETMVEHLVKNEPERTRPDVFIYLLDLAAAMRIDIGAAVEAKRGVLMQRWGDPENVAPGTPRPA